MGWFSYLAWGDKTGDVAPLVDGKDSFRVSGPNLLLCFDIPVSCSVVMLGPSILTMESSGTMILVQEGLIPGKF